jgi:hypothetical protein
MKYTILKCDCCGKTFVTEYYNGGYIDHYVNFVRNFPCFIKEGKNKVFGKVVYDGNELRDKDDIKVRLSCFKVYCERNNLLSFYSEVEKEVTKHLSHLCKLDEIRKEISKLVEGLEDEDKEYLGLEYQEY